jgi:uncharacterized membrane protein
MIWLILGLALWVGAHAFKRVAPDARVAMGDKGKGLVAVLVLASMVLMVIGYRGAEVVPLWNLPGFAVHINNLLMVLAFYLYAASAAKGAKIWLGRKIRHPQLTAVMVWAVAHLLVNGDVASLVLFGGIGFWAAVSVVVINRAEGPWVVPAAAPARKEIVALVVTVVVVGVVMGIHTWLGVRPFG